MVSGLNNLINYRSTASDSNNSFVFWLLVRLSCTLVRTSLMKFFLEKISECATTATRPKISQWVTSERPKINLTTFVLITTTFDHSFNFLIFYYNYNNKHYMLHQSSRNSRNSIYFFMQSICSTSKKYSLYLWLTIY